MAVIPTRFLKRAVTRARALAGVPIAKHNRDEEFLLRRERERIAFEERSRLQREFIDADANRRKLAEQAEENDDFLFWMILAALVAGFRTNPQHQPEIGF